MSAKLNNGLYKDRASFEADFRLMVNNSKTYNSSGTYVHGEAVALEQFFDKRQPLSLTFIFSIADTLIRMGPHQQDRRIPQERASFYAAPSSPCNSRSESGKG